MNYVISHESQTIPVPNEIGSDEGKLRRALASIIPGIAEAKINYSAEKDGVITITIAKQAGTKGAASPLDLLIACEGGKNAVIHCFETFRNYDFSTIPAAEIETINSLINISMATGLEQKQKMANAIEQMTKTRPMPSPVVVLGF